MTVVASKMRMIVDFVYADYTHETLLRYTEYAVNLMDMNNNIPINKYQLS